MEPAKKQQHWPITNLGKFGGEDFFGRIVDWRRCFDSEWRDSFVRTIEPKRFTGFDSFLFGGEDDGSSVAQNAIFGPRPVKPLLQMLQRIGPLEPRIKHAMWENVVRRGRSGETPPNRQARILPHAVDDYTVVAAAVLSQPRQ